MASFEMSVLMQQMKGINLIKMGERPSDALNVPPRI